MSDYSDWKKHQSAKQLRWRSAAIRYQEMVYLHEVNRLSLEEVGKRVGLTKQRVSKVLGRSYKDPDCPTEL